MKGSKLNEQALNPISRYLREFRAPTGFEPLPRGPSGALMALFLSSSSGLLCGPGALLQNPTNLVPRWMNLVVPNPCAQFTDEAGKRLQYTVSLIRAKSILNVVKRDFFACGGLK